MFFKFETTSFFILLVCLNIKLSIQHGSMIEPLSRSNAWLYDKEFESCCRFYDYTQMNCGGIQKLWSQNDGKCGICGEAWDEPKNFEKNGKKYLGKIVRTYQKDSSINVTIQITANHKGYFEFRICNIDGWEGDATEECLNKTYLRAENSQEQKFNIKNNETVFTISYNLRLPNNLTCSHCVLQWHWVTANYWGRNENDNRECLGCGKFQENTYGCSDIAIKDLANPRTSGSTSTSSTTKYSTTQATTSTSSTSTTTTTTITTTTKKSDNPTTITNQGCQVKLEFGQSLPNVKQSVTRFCEDVCGSKCLALISEYEKELYVNSSSKPTADLLTCLDTCRMLCTCHTARIP